MDESLAALLRNTVDVLPAGELERRLARARDEKRPLRVKLGIDPTAPAVTLGHAVVLDRLRAFQDAGHQAVLIVGDYTARVGDPSERSRTRPMLSADEVDANAAVMLAEYGSIVDMERVELRRNSEWLEPLGTAGLLELAARTTVARILERDDFAKRYAERSPISLQELFYPLLQGYDSVAIDADVELGGTDQKFNLLMGRHLQEEWGRDGQVVVTSPLLVGTDGVQKMSKSLGNFIGVSEPAETMYAKVMRVDDAALPEYYRLASGLPEADVDAALDSLADGSLPPYEAKHALARAVAARFRGAAAAEAAAAEFLRVHRDHALPSEVPEVPLPAGETAYVPALMVEHLGVSSASEARRLMAGGGVRLDGEVLEELEVPTSRLAGRVLQRGRRGFVRFSAVP